MSYIRVLHLFVKVMLHVHVAVTGQPINMTAQGSGHQLDGCAIFFFHREMCKGWHCQKEHVKQKTEAVMERRDFERAGTNGQEWKTIAEDRGRWRVNNESGRSYQVTWNPPSKEARRR